MCALSDVDIFFQGLDMDRMDARVCNESNGNRGSSFRSWND